MENNKENVKDEIVDNEEGKVKKRPSMMVFDRRLFEKLVIRDLSSSGNSGFLKKYSQSEIRDLIENYKRPANQKTLVDISSMLYAKSNQYKRLVQYFAHMATFSYVITPVKDIKSVGADKIRKQYVKVAELLRMMNLKHEMSKVLNICYVEDVIYGYVHITKTDFYVEKLNPTYCKISSIEDGVFNFSVDMNYFKSNPDLLLIAPMEIQSKFKSWESEKSRSNKKGSVSDWVELDSRNTMCIKLNENFLETLPPFVGSFDAIFDIDAFKQLRKDREEIQNYMLITQELPLRKDSDNNNDYIIDHEDMMYFHNMASDVTPDNVGVITSPMKVDTVKFDRDRVDSDGVAKAERDFWNSNGTSQAIFSTDKNTAQGILMSIKTDEEMVFDSLNQIERWLNRFLRFNIGNSVFGAKILPVTIFNRNEMFKQYLEASTFGLPTKSHLSSTIGLEPIETMGLSFLENEVLQFSEEWIPLKSSHTTSGDDISTEKGRPTNEEKGESVSDETARAEDKDGHTEKQV